MNSCIINNSALLKVTTVLGNVAWGFTARSQHQTLCLVSCFTVKTDVVSGVGCDNKRCVFLTHRFVVARCQREHERVPHWAFYLALNWSLALCSCHLFFFFFPREMPEIFCTLHQSMCCQAPGAESVQWQQIWVQFITLSLPLSFSILFCSLLPDPHPVYSQSLLIWSNETCQLKVKAL